MSEMRVPRQIFWHIKNVVHDELVWRGYEYLGHDFEHRIATEAYRQYQKSGKVDESVVAATDYYLEKIKSVQSPTDPFAATPPSGGGGENPFFATPNPAQPVGSEAGGAAPPPSVSDPTKVQCAICGKTYKALHQHLLSKHHMKPEEYESKYPGWPLRAKPNVSKGP